MRVAKLIKEDCMAYSVMVRISTIYYFQKVLSLKVLEYKVGLNRRIKFACIAMCSLVMSLCSRDLLVTSLMTITIH